MKILAGLLAVAISTLTISGCASTNSDSDSNSDKTTKASTTVTTVAQTTDEVTTETFTLPSKETFAEIPAEAEESFNCVISAVKKSHPTEIKGSKRLYGYLGEEEINGEDCYIFAVYDKKKDVHTEVATVAVSKESGELFVYNAETMTYDVLDISEDNSSATEYAWAECEEEISEALDSTADESEHSED